jgi:membrane protease YdiL (CAAX protease family)
MNPESINQVNSPLSDPLPGHQTPFRKDIHPAIRLVVLIGLVLLGGGLFLILGTFAAVLIYHLNIFSNPNLFNDTSVPGVIPALKIIQTASALGVFVLPALFFARMSDRKPLTFLRLTVFPKVGWLLLAMCMMVVAGPLINLMGELNSRMNLPSTLAGVQKWMQVQENDAARLTTAFLKADGISGLVINLIIVALLAAIGEEFLFRGVLQGLLFDWMKNRHVAIWVTAIVFSAFHVQFFGFLPRMALGAMLGYLYVWSGSLWVPVLAHFTNNAFGVIITYLIQHKTISAQAENLGNSKEDLLYVLLSLVLTTVFIVLGWRNRKTSDLPAETN